MELKLPVLNVAMSMTLQYRFEGWESEYWIHAWNWTTLDNQVDCDAAGPCYRSDYQDQTTCEDAGHYWKSSNEWQEFSWRACSVANEPRSTVKRSSPLSPRQWQYQILMGWLILKPSELLTQNINFPVQKLEDLGGSTVMRW